MALLRDMHQRHVKVFVVGGKRPYVHVVVWALQEDSYTEGIDVRLGADDVVSIASGGSAELALWDGVLSIADVGADSADIIVSDGVSQVHAIPIWVAGSATLSAIVFTGSVPLQANSFM